MTGLAWGTGWQTQTQTLFVRALPLGGIGGHHRGHPTRSASLPGWAGASSTCSFGFTVLGDWVGRRDIEAALRGSLCSGINHSFWGQVSHSLTAQAGGEWTEFVHAGGFWAQFLNQSTIPPVHPLSAQITHLSAFTADVSKVNHQCLTTEGTLLFFLLKNWLVHNFWWVKL